MADYNVNTISLDDLLFILGGFIFQGDSSDEIDIALLLRLDELVTLKLQERTDEISEAKTIH